MFESDVQGAHEAIPHTLSRRFKVRCIRYTVDLSFLCIACGSSRALVSSKSHDGSIVRCSDCYQALGCLSDIRRELADKARGDASALAKRIYRQGRGAKRS
jgi:hypothetical protein